MKMPTDAQIAATPNTMSSDSFGIKLKEIFK